MVVHLLSCKKEYSCEQCIDPGNVIIPGPTVNQPPIAIATYDSLNGQPPGSKFVTAKHSTDPDGSIVSYQWKKINGPASSFIMDPAKLETVITNLVQGNYQVELTVTDNGGLSARDTIEIPVNILPTNTVIFADAGPDQTITLPLDSTYLDGRLITPNGFNPTGPVNFYWTMISGPILPELTLPSRGAGGLARTVTVSRNMVPGVYLFTFRMTSTSGSSNIDTVKVTVLDDPQNRNTVTYHDLEWTEGDPATIGRDIIFISTSLRPDIFTTSGGIKPIEISLKPDAASPFMGVPFRVNSGYTWEASPYVAWIATVPNNPALLGKRSDLRVRFL